MIGRRNPDISKNIFVLTSEVSGPFQIEIRIQFHQKFIRSAVVCVIKIGTVVWIEKGQTTGCVGQSVSDHVQILM
ncbi:hypothetical protein SDC9_101569 [bioreactor metagenome]|uniref:Uncharacterized protein n=1 Tax=bioreactor metagenome TaxID=1076179 RepID=A0A645ANP0_9ZZZZ